MINDLPVLFFDETSVAQPSYQNKIWTAESADPKIILKSSFKPVKALATMTYEGWQTIQFIEKLSEDLLYAFLEKSILEFQEKNNKKTIVIFLDNAPSHRAKKIMDLTNKYDVVFLFNAVATPCLNIIENLFEVLKRTIRRSTFRDKYTSVSLMLDQLRKVDEKLIHQKILKEVLNFEKIILKNSL